MIKGLGFTGLGFSGLGFSDLGFSGLGFPPTEEVPLTSLSRRQTLNPRSRARQVTLQRPPEGSKNSPM